MSYEALVAQETLILAATEAICEAMEPDQQDESGHVSRKELADRLGKSKSYVTQILSGDRNMTLRTLADVAGVLDRRVTIRLEPIPGPPDQTLSPHQQVDKGPQGEGKALRLVRELGRVLLIGFVTLWAAAGLALLGWPVNPYLTWYVLWGGCGLVLVWKLKRAENRQGEGKS